MTGENEVSDKQWCFAWFQATPPKTGADKAVLVKDCKWDTGATITIAFLDGTDEQKELVKKHAVGWTDGLANLNFSWVNGTAANIRITFKFKGSWSVIGTTCKHIPAGRATMNFGWLTPNVSDDEARRVILHEFGHALGLIHEHQNPDHQIQWNEPAVIADLSGPPNNWDLETITHNMFEAYPRNEVNGTTLDANSIMMYPIPASWTLDGTTAGTNADLSSKDKSFIRQQYP
jgi:serralysin